MARKLKTYVTSLGFFDQAIAAPSMKAALEAWGTESNLFHQGAAKETDDPRIVAATMAAPGVVLKRPVGSSGAFKEHADLPTDLPSEGRRKQSVPRAAGRKAAKKAKPTGDAAARKKAALAYEKEQARRDRARAKEEAAREKDRVRRQAAVDKAQLALDAARVQHEASAAAIQDQIEALEGKLKAVEARWDEERARLESTLRQARKQP
jgi:hypothetical protein